MENNRIYLYELESYQRATPEQIKKMHSSPYNFFDLEKLSHKKLQEEMRAFLLERENRLSIRSVTIEVQLYNLLCRFFGEKEPQLKSILDKPLQELVKGLKVWLLKNGYLIAYKSSSKIYGSKNPTDAASVAFLKKLYAFTKPKSELPEQEKDIWILKNLKIPLLKNPIYNVKSLNFSKISQQVLKEELKAVLYMELKNIAVSTVVSELSSMKRFSKFLAERFPAIQSFREVTRETMEAYLTFLNTEVEGKKSFRTELLQMKSLFIVIGKYLEKPDMENLFLPGDIPREVRTLFRSYSDDEIIRINKHLVEMDEQIARALICHQMLGTRISDTLTLKTDCLYVKNGHTIIKIEQVKSRSSYEKPVSDDLAALLKKAMAYTKEHYGDTEYIFVSDSDPNRPMQYAMIHSRVRIMILENDIRDNNGELFGFNTHMFRHTFGRKLTEMHLDDYTISRLLGHSDTSCVKYYRKLGNDALAKETKEMRENMDLILLDIIKGWDEYGEIRTDGV